MYRCKERTRRDYKFYVNAAVNIIGIIISIAIPTIMIIITN